MTHVSVVMPSYQHRTYIGAAIESVRCQTWADWDLVIVDDGSTDGSPEVIRALAEADPRIDSIFHERNLGIARTFNDGVRGARGPLVAFLASDDCWEPTKLERQLRVWNESPQSVVFSDAMLCDGSLTPSGLRLWANSLAGHGEVLEAIARRGPGALEEPLPAETEAVSLSGREIIRRMLAHQLPCLSTFLLVRDLVAEIGFDEGLHYANDFKLVAELALRRDFRFLDAPLLRYRIHGENASLFSDRGGWQEDMAKIRKLVFDVMVPHSRQPESL